MKLVRLWKTLKKKVLEQSSSETRIEYLRKQGVRFGQNCYCESLEFSTEPFLIEIGNHVAISSGTEFMTHDGSVWIFENDVDGGIFGEIKIGNNVFIGMNCSILSNTIIGDNSVIGAGSVVRGHFPDNSIILGNPAKVVMKTSLFKTMVKQNPGFAKTNNLSIAEVNKIVKKHFGID